MGGEMDGEDVEEDKRRRNTEASARFRGSSHCSQFFPLSILGLTLGAWRL